MSIQDLKKRVFNINNKDEFRQAAIEIFLFQYSSCEIYKRYVDELKIDPASISELDHIPFLPIEFFKSHKVRSVKSENSFVFHSSGTTSNSTSKHYISDIDIYESSFIKSFETHVTKVENTQVIGLLPHYQENPNSSLLHMVNRLVELSNEESSGFVTIESFVEMCRSGRLKKNSVLFAVPYVLLDLCETDLQLGNCTIIETGGMKGRRKELIRSELHQIVNESLKPKRLMSEYGMTELLSQAYYTENKFRTPSWMSVLCRPIDDPLSTIYAGKGALNVIDLANLESCSFIATEDQGEVFENGGFSVSGRIDHSQIRGCNLLV